MPAPDGTCYGEADTRSKLIDPAIHARGWTEDFIKREETAGAIEMADGQPARATRGKVDYVLRLRITATAQPVAVAYIEAKRENKLPSSGLEQVKRYQAAARRLSVPFVYSSNGHLFVEHDAFTGQTSLPRAIAEFPTPEDLRSRYESGKGFALNSEAAKPLLVPYPGGEASRRYYQDAAIRAVFEKIATGRPGSNRVLLSLATGAGKTFIAVNLLRRIADAGQLTKALFVCDRDELRTQALTAFGNVFGADAADVFEADDGKNHARNARIHIATYQTLNVDSDADTASFLLRHYPPNTFSHVIIDECHRSAWGKWRVVLERNAGAIQIGLTATPRQLSISAKKRDELAALDGAGALADDLKLLADNVRYFGEPVYEYSLQQGIEDGYLAPPEIFSFDLFHDGRPDPERVRRIAAGDLTTKKVTDATTGAISLPDQASYGPADLEKRLLLPERVAACAQHLFAQLLARGETPEQKTIIFTATDWHAQTLASQLNSLYADWCAIHGRPPQENFAFQCTQKSGGAAFVADLRKSVSSHFIACTVELLSTGVDVPCVRNIVFLKYVRSPIAFHQMLGRGTRLDPESDKLMFRVFDYTDATSLLGEDFFVKPRGPAAPRPPGPPPPPPKIVEGVAITFTDTGRYLSATLDGRTQRVTIEDYRQLMAARLLAVAPDVALFRSKWIKPAERRALIDAIVQGGLSPRALQLADETTDADLFDVLGELAYGVVRRTRGERAHAFTYKQAPWLHTLPPQSAATVKALASQFGKGGTDALETPQIFSTPEVMKAGGLDALKLIGKPADVLEQTKEKIFAA